MTATKFEGVYDLFLSQIDDYGLAQSEESVVEDVLQKYLLNGYLHIYSVLGDVNISTESKAFSRELTMIEKLLFAKAMKLEWVGEKLNSEELMRKEIGDRDYHAVQGVAYIKELRGLYAAHSEELSRSKIDYTYNNEDMFKELLN